MHNSSIAVLPILLSLQAIIRNKILSWFSPGLILKLGCVLSIYSAKQVQKLAEELEEVC